MNGKTILLVDDDRTFVVLITATLREHGYEVIVAQNGSEAFRHLRESRPDLIILDVLMPEMTGYDFVQKIRDVEEVKDVPIIVMSARKSMRDFFPVWQIHSFLFKPFKPAELLQKIEDALRGSFTAETEGAAFQAVPASGRGKKAFIMGTEDYVNEKIRAVLEERGFEVEASTNVGEGIQEISRLRPNLILCKFHENPQVIDAERIYRQLQKIMDKTKFTFLVFCDYALGVDALKCFNHSQIIAYDKIAHLTVKLATYLDQGLSSSPA